MNSPSRPVALATILLLSISLVGCGDSHDSGGADGAVDGTTEAVADAGGEPRVVEVTMADIRFQPDVIEVQRGETIRFRFTNEGAIPHDAFVGSADEQDDHEAEMTAAAQDGGDGHDHGGDMNAVTVQPGDTQTITHTFDEAGELEIGCHQPGHYDAGMKVSIAVD